MSDRWLATVAPDIHPVATESESGPPLDPDVAALGKQIIEATRRLLVVKQESELATGKRYRLRLRHPRHDVNGTPSVTLTIDLEPEE